ncbi:hypothetical protein [Candidatus Parabeggiatoa sp. HSG14]|uniref:hypothetical protein n=1 Tax=Candidatus Parabeggiatoa sp. HSG14 TaxID=3055593 RepID=UPI0025A8D90B|nr:hypothetical protein [Thiotrichales bacterium HSG14]
MITEQDGNANFFIGGAFDNAKSSRSPIYAARTSLLKITGNLETPYDKTFTWGKATRNGGILKQILMFPINFIKAIFGIKGHSYAFKHIKNLRDTGKISQSICLYGHSWGGAASLRLCNELEEMGISVEQVNTFDPVSRISRVGKPSGSNAEWNNYYPSSRTRKFPDTIAKLGSIWGKRQGADNNYLVTNWINKQEGKSGHMGVLYPYEKKADRLMSIPTKKH